MSEKITNYHAAIGALQAVAASGDPASWQAIAGQVVNAVQQRNEELNAAINHQLRQVARLRSEIIGCGCSKEYRADLARFLFWLGNDADAILLTISGNEDLPDWVREDVENIRCRLDVSLSRLSPPPLSLEAKGDK